MKNDIKELVKYNIPPIAEETSDKDYLFSSLLPNMKKFDRKEKILTEMTRISDQGQLPSCTSNAACDGFEYVLSDKVDLSRLFVYWNSRIDKLRVTGTTIRAALDSIRVHGVPPEDVWPYNSDKVNINPDENAWSVAKQRRRTTYYRVKTCQEIIAAIDAGWPVIFCILLDKIFVNNWPSPDHVFTGETETDSSHAMLIVGYRKTEAGYQFRVRNSWGPYWCDKGYCWFIAGYIEKLQDAWAVTNYEPKEALFSRRNVAFAACSFVIVAIAAFCLCARDSITMTQLVSTLVMLAVFQTLAVWRRWWINITINDKLKLF